MNRTILAVDDSMSIRETVKLTLESAGYRVILAEDGSRAMAVARMEKADLVVTDLNMPAMDGLALIAGLRALPSYRFVPILMLTTESQEEKKLAGRRAGATGWIVKPFEPLRFLAVVKKVCPVS